MGDIIIGTMCTALCCNFLLQLQDLGTCYRFLQVVHFWNRSVYQICGIHNFIHEGYVWAVISNRSCLLK